MIQTPEQPKSRRLCHINMLKEYYSPSVTSAKQYSTKPVAVSVSMKSTVEEDTIQHELRLINSDVLSNLDKKLNHLP